MTDPSRDVVVVGGGIHGAGVAQAAAAAGHHVLVLEMGTLAHATSSRSSKLIHGGLRYLETGHVGLVRESLQERSTLLRLAPDLVRLVPFHLPVYRDTRRRPWTIRAGLSLYALLGGLGAAVRFRSLPRTEWLALDGLRRDGLQAVFQYQDARTDDAALTRAVARSAEELGAEVLTGARLLSAESTGEGYRVVYRHHGREVEVRCRALVNAGGPWANRILETVVPAPPRLEVDLVQGAHLVLRGPLERGAYYAEAPRDRRAIFFIPWKGNTLVGTTETPFGGVPDRVAPTEEEVDYLLGATSHYFPGRDPDLLESFAGLRVLPRGDGPAFGRSRELILLPDRPREPRLVTLYGGKLTTYRSSSQRVLRLLQGVLPRREPRADTRELPLRRPPVTSSGEPPAA